MAPHPLITAQFGHAENSGHAHVTELIITVLTQPWPPHLHPSRVPFQKRTATMMQRAGLWDDMTQIDQLCTCDIAARDGIGPVTVIDLLSHAPKAGRWSRPGRVTGGSAPQT